MLFGLTLLVLPVYHVGRKLRIRGIHAGRAPRTYICLLSHATFVLLQVICYNGYYDTEYGTTARSQ